VKKRRAVSLKGQGWDFPPISHKRKKREGACETYASDRGRIKETHDRKQKNKSISLKLMK